VLDAHAYVAPHLSFTGPYPLKPTEILVHPIWDGVQGSAFLNKGLAKSVARSILVKSGMTALTGTY
jgi:hypothetical protein